MNRIASFERVSDKQFVQDWCKTYGTCEQEARAVYQMLISPKRATSGSAGYDFFAPAAFTLAPNETINIPTGFRTKIEEGWLLALFPRSGLGFRYRMQMNNTVGIVDSDYYHADNEGHIFIKLTNATNENRTVHVSSGQGFAQGIFLPFGLTLDDDAGGVRHGGFGSTNIK